MFVGNLYLKNEIPATPLVDGELLHLCTLFSPVLHCKLINSQQMYQLIVIKYQAIYTSFRKNAAYSNTT